jgi:hypothetical protein
MKRNHGKLAAIAIAAATLAPAAASAMPPIQDGSDGHPNAVVCGKDYSRNSVDGNYCIRSVPSSAVVPVSAPPAKTTVSHHGFIWGDAFAGAGVAAVIFAGAAGATGLRRRRRQSIGSVRHSTPLAG